MKNMENSDAFLSLIYRSQMGIMESGYLPMHPLCWNPPEFGCSYLQGEECQLRYLDTSTSCCMSSNPLSIVLHLFSAISYWIQLILVKKCKGYTDKPSVYDTQVVTYWSEIWPLTKSLERKLRCAQRGMEGSVLGITIMNKKNWKWIREQIKVDSKTKAVKTEMGKGRSHKLCRRCRWTKRMTLGNHHFQPF